MIDWIEANGPADSAHSLNGLSIAGIPFDGAVVRRHGQRQVLPVHGHPAGCVRCGRADAPSAPARGLTWPSRSTSRSASAAGPASRHARRGPSPRAATSPSSTRSTRCCATTARQCLVVCPVDGLVADTDWAVCHGRGCPLSSSRYAGVECSEGRQLCPTCGSVLWRVEGGEWTCRVCAAAADGSRVASCPKVKRMQRLTHESSDVVRR